MERLDKLPNGWPIWQDDSEFKFTLDAVLLAAFPLLRNDLQIVELGSGCGAVSLMLAARCESKITGVDINSNVNKLFKRSISLNCLSDRVNVVQADINDLKSILSNEGYDLVVSNPPYRKVGTGKLRKDGAKNACHELTGKTVDFIQAAKFLVKYKGRFIMVHLAERLPEILYDCQSNGFEAKRLQFVHSKKGDRAKLFLLELTKGGNQGLQVLPPLIVYDSEGKFTEEVLQIYNF